MLLPSLFASILTLASVDMQSCYVTGSEKEVECAMFDVPLTYQKETNESVQLHVVRHRAWSNEKPPVFVLAGGPGQAATEMTHMLNTAFKEVKKQHDIVFVAQRGSGLSSAQSCRVPQTNDIPTVTQAMQACQPVIKPIEEQLSTDTLARDIEWVRKSLGYSSIHLWGGSYGTFAAQHYAATFPVTVQSLVLDAAVALDGNPLVAGNRYPQQSLERLDSICQQDQYCSTQFPDWKNGLDTLLTNAELSPMSISYNGQEMQLDRHSIASLVRTSLYSPEWAARLPLAVTTALQGDTRIFGTLNSMILDTFNSSMYVGLTLGVLCQEHVYDGQEELVSEAGEHTFVGDSYYQFWLSACGSERIAQADYITTPKSLSMPTLLISGTLDPITPEQSAEQALSYLTNAQHIVIPNASHTNSGRGCMPKLLNEFFVTGGVSDATCITSHQFPPFML